MKKIIIAILAIALVATGAMFILAQQSTEKTEGKRGFGKRGGQHRGGHGMMFRGLDLTDAQKEQIKQIREASRTNLKPVMDQMRANRQKLRQLTANGTFDEAQVRAAAAERANLSAQMMVERQRVKSQIFQVLTDEQKAKAAQMREQRKERFQNRTKERRGRGKAQNSATEM